MKCKKIRRVAKDICTAEYDFRETVLFLRRQHNDKQQS